MVVHAAGRGIRLPRFMLATRPVRPDRRRVPRDDFILRDSVGILLGVVTGVRGGLRFGPLAPTLYLRRVTSLPGERPVM
jgi:hypothetical protein